MPTFERLPQFLRDFRHLTPEQQAVFKAEVLRWAKDLKQHGLDPTDPRISGIRGAPGIFEFRWAPDGRAAFEFGPQRRPGEPHLVWRRVGTHALLKNP